MATDENPIEKGPNGVLKFRVMPLTEQDDPHPNYSTFAPAFYPDRFNQTNDKELRKEGQQCRGEDVSIKNFKNPEFHATGVLLEENLRVFQELLKFDGKVDLLTPVVPGDGVKCVIKKGEVGEIEGWNPGGADIDPQWMFNYTLDLVSTGEDEFGNVDGNDIVQSRISSATTVEVSDDIDQYVSNGGDSVGFTR